VPGTETTDEVRRYYDKTASRYDRQIKLFERILFGDGRRWVCSQAQGDVLELAVGTGRNLRFYPNDVRLTGIELSHAMLDLAKHEAAALGREADLRVGDAQLLDFADESFDTVTCTLSLCTTTSPASRSTTSATSASTSNASSGRSSGSSSASWRASPRPSARRMSRRS